MVEKNEVKIDNHPDVSGFSKCIKKCKRNPWIISTICISLIALILLSVVAFGSGSKTVSGKVAGDKIIEFAKNQGVEATLVSVEDMGSVYETVISIEGQELPLYVTKDGNYFIQSLIPLTSEITAPTQTETPTEVPQTDKPEVGLYIWSYCPYGVTALGPFADVAKLLGDAADFKVYTYYAGHGDYEVQQNEIQACIQELGYDYWDYAKTFADTIYDKCYGDTTCDLEESVSLMKSLGIDSTKVLACVDSKGKTYTDSYASSAQAAGVTGSPTLVINGVKVSVARTAEAYKTAVCSAFTDAPNGCDETLSSTGTTASGSC